MPGPIPDFDKKLNDSHNLFVVILNVTENGFYRLGTSKSRIWKINLCPMNLLRIVDSPDDAIPL